jgi:hypothetical protein
MFPRDIVCLRNISADTLHKEYTEDDDDDDDNNNNNNKMTDRGFPSHLSAKRDSSHEN